MNDCQILFYYRHEEKVIQCQRNELIRDIIMRYREKSNLPVDEFDFFYEGNIINQGQTLEQINKKDEEILFYVFPKTKEKNENTMKK